jgi:heptosyltransferase II
MTVITKQPARLVVLAPNWLGDAVMALPLFTDLRRAWPECLVTVAARAAVAPLYRMVGGVADVITLEGRAGRNALTTWRTNARRLADGQFDAVLLLPNSFVSAWMAKRAGIPERWGFARDLRGRLLTVAVARPPGHVHQAEYYQALGLALGIGAGDRFARVTLQETDLARARDLLTAHDAGGEQRFVVFAPGAAYGRAKQWLPERFAELAHLLGRAGIKTALVGATSDEDACADIARRAPAINLAGQTDLSTLAALFALSAGVVANDSGAMHLASAVGARVVALFGPTDHRKTSPLRADANAVPATVIATNVWCRPCMLRECPIDHRCMTGITAAAVFAALAID